MMTRLLCLLVIACSGLDPAAHGAPPRKKGPAPATEWNADIDLAGLDATLKAAFQNEQGVMPQQGMNSYTAAMAGLYDAQLFITYSKLLRKLPADETARLEAEQNKWRATRDRLVKAAGESEGGGSASPAAANEEFIRLTRERERVLRGQLSAPR